MKTNADPMCMRECVPIVLESFRSIPSIMTEHWFVIPMMGLAHYMGEPWYQGLVFWLFFTGFWGVLTFAYTRLFPREIRLGLSEVAWHPLVAMISMAYILPLVSAAYIAESAIHQRQKKSEALETEQQTKEF